MFLHDFAFCLGRPGRLYVYFSTALCGRLLAQHFLYSSYDFLVGMIAFAGRCWCPEVGLGIMFPVPIVVLPSLAVLRVQKLARAQARDVRLHRNGAPGSRERTPP